MYRPTPNREARTSSLDTRDRARSHPTKQASRKAIKAQVQNKSHSDSGAPFGARSVYATRNLCPAEAHRPIAGSLLIVDPQRPTHAACWIDSANRVNDYSLRFGLASYSLFKQRRSVCLEADVQESG